MTVCQHNMKDYLSVNTGKNEKREYDKEKILKIMKQRN